MIAIKRTPVKNIKPGDLIVSTDQFKELLVVLSIKLLDINSSIAMVTFLDSNNKISQNGGWVVLYKVTV